MLGEQPLKFYSEEVTETKIQLINRLLIMNAQKNISYPMGMTGIKEKLYDFIKIKVITI